MRAALAFVLLFFLLPVALCGQDPTALAPHANIWYFGHDMATGLHACRIDFHNGQQAPTIGPDPNSVALPSPFVQGAGEGMSSVCNSSGQLFAYTDGLTVYNRMHQPMLNGTGILGDAAVSSTQGSMFIPMPGNPNRYYLFTTEAYDSLGDPSPNGFRYNIIDAALDGGLGGIVAGKKNVLLFAPTSEKLAAVHHCNGRDIWVMAMEYFTNRYHAYLLSDTGLAALPVTSQLGITYDGDSYYQGGAAKFSPDGKLFAANYGRNSGSSYAQIFRFDNSTGYLYNAFQLPGYEGQYGLSFSPDASKLYHFRPDIFSFVQYDVSVFDSAAIVSSAEIFEATGAHSMQLGPDHKLYIGINATDSIWICETPNLLISDTNFYFHTVSLNGGFGRPGFNNHPDSYFNEVDSAFPCSISASENQGENLTFKVFPSPFHNEIAIEHSKKLNRVRIINSLGQTVLDYHQLLPPRNNFDVSALPLGSYWLLIENEGKLEVFQILKH